jgi:hypothetical protein
MMFHRHDRVSFQNFVTNSHGAVWVGSNDALRIMSVVMAESNMVRCTASPRTWGLSVMAGTNRVGSIPLAVQSLTAGQGHPWESALPGFDLQRHYGMISFMFHERLLGGSTLGISEISSCSGTEQTMPVREITATGPAPGVATIPDPFASATNVWDRGRFRIWLKAQRGRAHSARDDGMHMAQMVVARPARAAEAWRVRLTVREGTDVLFRAEMAWKPLSKEASRHRARLDPSHDPALEYDRLNFSVAESVAGAAELEFVRTDAAENPAEWKAFRLTLRELNGSQW